MNRFRIVTALLIAVFAVSACSEDPLDVEAAQEQFCSDVRDYIDSVGQYGGLFQDVELTVGDVRNAQQELEPGLEAVRESAAAFQEAVEADPDSAVSIDLVEPESIEAVEEAEAAFAAASDVEDRTTIVDAGVEFSSAAYQLEVAWVRLFNDAGCLEGDEEAQAEAQQWVSDYVAAIQTDFRALGYYNGAIDGIYGPRTIEAVEQFQEENGLPVTGLVDPATMAAVNAALAGRESAQVGALQAIMIAAGYYDGSVDGQWSAEVEAALMAMQEDLGLEPTGVIDAATLRAIEDALAAAGQAPEIPSTTVPSETPTTAPVAPPTTEAPAATTTTTPAATTTTAAAGDLGTLLDVLDEAGQFTQFLAAVDAAGLAETLSGAGPFTVFAPTDEAFAAASLPADPEALTALVQYHIVEGDVSGFDLPAATSLVTLQGGEITVAIDGGLVVLNGASTVSLANVASDNGVAHVVTTVLLPPG